jgi:hypothetical protein
MLHEKNSQNSIQSDPLEVSLVYTVRSCRTCQFFWPLKDAQPYGPFPTYDFVSNTPKEGQPPSPWVTGKTSEPGFPNPEIMDGCRKAPIMTIGINPNLTAFSPGQKGASWCYPDFTSDDNTDKWTKYAYYYRYRSICQECFSLEFIKSQLLPEGQVIAEDSGTVVSAYRNSDSPNYMVYVQYDNSVEETKIPLERNLGEPRYVLLFDTFAPNNRFEKGDIIAAKLNVLPGQSVEVYQQKEEYYQQFIPTLEQFEHYLQYKGHNAHLHMGEDVCQLDMVGCASPHWSPDYLGGTYQSEDTIITNCVSANAFAIKQIVQTEPVVLFLVGESSYNMFKDAFGKYIMIDPPLPTHPEDGAFTLFRATTDLDNPCLFSFSTTIDGITYSITTQIVITPHFSYDSNFLPQFRMSSDDWDAFKTDYYDCYRFLITDYKRVKYVPPEKEGYYMALELIEDAKGVLADLKKEYPDALSVLMNYFYNAHTTMAEVLCNLYSKNKLTYTDGTNSSGYLTRTEGSCHFCVNNHWEFPLKCPYKKTTEKPPPLGFLEKVAEEIVAGGKDNTQ